MSKMSKMEVEKSRTVGFFHAAKLIENVKIGEVKSFISRFNLSLPMVQENSLRPIGVYKI
jgi:hypothetical protein